jgi:hypothetical protein
LIPSQRAAYYASKKKQKPRYRLQLASQTLRVESNQDSLVAQEAMFEDEEDKAMLTAVGNEVYLT